jgi:hypothetical protein
MFLEQGIVLLFGVSYSSIVAAILNEHAGGTDVGGIAR